MRICNTYSNYHMYMCVEHDHHRSNASNTLMHFPHVFLTPYVPYTECSSYLFHVCVFVLLFALLDLCEYLCLDLCAIHLIIRRMLCLIEYLQKCCICKLNVCFYNLGVLSKPRHPGPILFFTKWSQIGVYGLKIGRIGKARIWKKRMFKQHVIKHFVLFLFLFPSIVFKSLIPLRLNIFQNCYRKTQNTFAEDTRPGLT